MANVRLQLYLAKKKDQIHSSWLLDNELLGAMSPSEVVSSCTKMRGTQHLINPKLFGDGISLGVGVVHVLLVVAVVPSSFLIYVSLEVHTQKLLRSLEWREPMRLCKSSGKDWPYQGISELAAVVTGPLVDHYESWQNGFQDMLTHALFLAVSGPGTGKSRMLDEMTSLLCEAAKRSKKQELVERLENAYVFNVTFGGDTPATEKMDFEHAEFDVSYRMLYQLTKERQSWSAFSFEPTHLCKTLPLSIGMVVNMLVELEKICNPKDMTLILCVDGLENLSSDSTKTCDLYRVLTSMCSFLNSSTAFVVCVCPTTDQKHVDQALSDSSQRRMYLHPPGVRGEELLKPRTRFEKQLVDDMGGIGRALEGLHEVLQRHYKDSSEEVDPAAIVDDVYDVLKRRYHEAFTTRSFDDPTTCQEILAVRRSYGVDEYITSTNVTVGELRNLGLFRWTPDRRLECAFILPVKLITKISQRVGESETCDEHIASSSKLCLN